MNAESYHILLFQPASLKYLQVLLYHIYSVFPYPSLRIRHLHDDVLRVRGDGHGIRRCSSHHVHDDAHALHGRDHDGVHGHDRGIRRCSSHHIHDDAHVLSLIHI